MTLAERQSKMGIDGTSRSIRSAESVTGENIVKPAISEIKTKKAQFPVTWDKACRL